MASDVETLDCGDNSCLYATKRGGMRTNGGCRCSLKIRYLGGDQEIELHIIRRALRRHGLDLCTAAERNVLKACAAMDIREPSVPPRPPAKSRPVPLSGVMPVIEAELSRRVGTNG